MAVRESGVQMASHRHSSPKQRRPIETHLLTSLWFIKLADMIFSHHTALIDLSLWLSPARVNERVEFNATRGKTRDAYQSFHIGYQGYVRVMQTNQLALLSSHRKKKPLLNSPNSVNAPAHITALTVFPSIHSVGHFTCIFEPLALCTLPMISRSLTSFCCVA